MNLYEFVGQHPIGTVGCLAILSHTPVAIMCHTPVAIMCHTPVAIIQTLKNHDTTSD